MRKMMIAALTPALLAGFASAALAGETLDRVMKNKLLVEVTDQAYPPFSYINESGEVVGFDIDIPQETAKRVSNTRSRRRPGRSSSPATGTAAGTSASAR